MLLRLQGVGSQVFRTRQMLSNQTSKLDDFLQQQGSRIWNKTQPDESFILWLPRGERIGTTCGEIEVLAPDIHAVLLSLLPADKDAVWKNVCLVVSGPNMDVFQLCQTHAKNLEFFQNPYLNQHVRVSIYGTDDCAYATDVENLTTQSLDVDRFYELICKIANDQCNKERINFSEEGGIFRVDVVLGTGFITTEWEPYDADVE